MLTKRRRWLWIIAAVLLPVSFPASQGPAVYAMNRGWWITPGAYISAYSPLEAAVSECPEIVESLHEWYVQWWVVLAGRHMGLLPERN